MTVTQLLQISLSGCPACQTEWTACQHAAGCDQAEGLAEGAAAGRRSS